MKLTKTRPKRGLEVRPGVWLVPDRSSELAVVDPSIEIPTRTDLPSKHPMRGRRVLSVVWAGSPDMEATREGMKVLIADVAPEPISR